MEKKSLMKQFTDGFSLEAMVKAMLKRVDFMSFYNVIHPSIASLKVALERQMNKHAETHPTTELVYMIFLQENDEGAKNILLSSFASSQLDIETILEPIKDAIPEDSYEKLVAMYQDANLLVMIPQPIEIPESGIKTAYLNIDTLLSMKPEAIKPFYDKIIQDINK